jgi:hypothetical protein
MKYLITLLVGISLFTSCKNDNSYKQKLATNELIIDVQGQVTDVMVHDIFSPPVASRIYFLSSLAAYETLAASGQLPSMVGKIKDLKTINAPKDTTISYELAASQAYLKVGKQLTFSADLYEDFDKKRADKIKNFNVPKEVLKKSLALGDSIGAQILKFAKGDNYLQTRGFRYTVTTEPGAWVPTPPGYMDGVEPFWPTIRTATLDSARQYAPAKPLAYSMTKGSAYYNQVMEVYNIVKNLTEEQRGIANFWDCNPFKLNVSGHASFATKKISPGGHWMSIVSQICRNNKISLAKTVQAYLYTSVSIYDGFISCWGEKYNYRGVRPESVINSTFDPNWVPTLQTPPFPEYTSGHSVISSAAAESLSHLFGDSFAFADSTEVQFGLPVRSYKSFREAASEASVSRLYGGIHFRPALDNGLVQGKNVGLHVIKKLEGK